jgi:hypothetical protein
MDEAINRLRNVANERISERAAKAFRAVREHRNRLVHFFHPDFARKAATAKIEEVVSDQFKAWLFLNQLVTGPWQRHFRRHAARLKRLDRTMHRLREFLKAKYDALKPDIRKQAKAGVLFERCSFCHFDAARVGDAGEPLFEGECFVCGWRHSSLHVLCPGCGGTIIVEDLGEGHCEKCGTDIDLEYLLDQYGPDGDPKEECDMAYCSECERTDFRTVVPHGDGYLCLSCQTLHDFVGNCGYCNERITGIDSVESYISGCIFCSGAIKDD